MSPSGGYAFVPSLCQYDPAKSGIVNQSSAQVTIPTSFVPGLDWITRGEFAREVQDGFSYDDVAGRTGLLYRRGPHSAGTSLNYVSYFHVSVQGVQNDDPTSPNASIIRECGAGCLSVRSAEPRPAGEGMHDQLCEGGPSPGRNVGDAVLRRVPDSRDLAGEQCRHRAFRRCERGRNPAGNAAERRIGGGSRPRA